jgi:hypothetical protein
VVQVERNGKTFCNTENYQVVESEIEDEDGIIDLFDDDDIN